LSKKSKSFSRPARCHSSKKEIIEKKLCTFRADPHPDEKRRRRREKRDRSIDGKSKDSLSRLHIGMATILFFFLSYFSSFKFTAVSLSFSSAFIIGLLIC
jgi:hypothetical protein